MSGFVCAAKPTCRTRRTVVSDSGIMGNLLQMEGFQSLDFVFVIILKIFIV